MAAPEPFLVRVIPDKEEQAPDPEKPCDEPPNRDWRDLCQQWRMADAAKKQLDLLTRQIDLAAAQNRIAAAQNELLSFQNYVLVLEAILLFLAFGASAVGTWLIRREFVASHRPQIVFRVALKNPHIDGATYEVLMRAVNVGTTPAYIKAISSAALIKTIAPAIVAVVPSKVDGIKLRSGQHCEWTQHSEPTTEIDRRAISAAQRYVYAIGTVVYMDGNKNVRHAGFCRRMDWGTNRFVATNDEDHEYSY